MQQADDGNTKDAPTESTRNHDLATRTIDQAVYDATLAFEHSAALADTIVEQLDSAGEWFDPIARGRQVASLGRILREYLDTSLAKLMDAEAAAAAMRA